MARILIVDDEESYLRVLKVIFGTEGYDVHTETDGRRALEYLEENACDLIISDVRMPDMDGIELLQSAREIAPHIGVVLMTAFGTIEKAREAFKLGADDFIQKPFNNEELQLIVKRTLEKQAVVNENLAFRQAQRRSGSMKNIIGESPLMQKMFRLIEQIAAESSTVLITGASGTGKELVARVIHDLSRRAKKPFIPINCGAIPEHLLEAEFFGHMKGAFTGAEMARTGLFEASHGGTIFLDEIGDMPLPMQVKMLRVLQDRKVRPVGSTREIPVDVRVIAATNRDIRELVEKGTFRHDLFYRLSVIPLYVPKLAERREDIPALVRHFVKKFGERSNKRISVSAEALKILEQREWEGNVRELEHTIERAVALTSDGGEIAAENCRADFLSGAAEPKHISLPADGLNFSEYMNELEKQLVTEALDRTGGNQTRAASLLQMPVHSLRHLLSKHDLHTHHKHG